MTMGRGICIVCAVAGAFFCTIENLILCAAMSVAELLPMGPFLGAVAGFVAGLAIAAIAEEFRKIFDRPRSGMKTAALSVLSYFCAMLLGMLAGAAVAAFDAAVSSGYVLLFRPDFFNGKDSVLGFTLGCAFFGGLVGYFLGCSYGFALVAHLCRREYSRIGVFARSILGAIIGLLIFLFSLFAFGCLMPFIVK